MLVETFECSETASEPIEATEEAIALMEQLGLEGQKELICKPEGKSDTRCPYREMTADEQFVYRVLCPASVKLGRYNTAPIPLRVLQVAAHASSLGMFDELIVWDREQAVVKDPVLVARKGSEWSSQAKWFILARWGEELETFATLVKRAVAIKREQFVQSLESIRAQVDSRIAQAQGMSAQEIVGCGAGANVEIRMPLP